MKLNLNDNHYVYEGDRVCKSPLHNLTRQIQTFKEQNLIIIKGDVKKKTYIILCASMEELSELEIGDIIQEISV